MSQADVQRVDEAQSDDAVRHRVERAILEIRAGRMVVVVDDEDRENEADLIMAAERATPESIAFMVRHTSGLLCVGMTGARTDALRLPLMVQDGDDPRGTAFTISVDVKAGTSTGISAADRAATLRALADPQARAEDFSRPGHVFPLRARVGGVLRRAGHTESSVDLCTLAGLQPAGVLCEITKDDGTMVRPADAQAFADEHGLAVIAVADLVRYRLRAETLVHRTASARLPTEYGDFVAHTYQSDPGALEHFALVCGDVDQRGGTDRGSEPVLTRVHSECLTGDVFASRRCDCGAQLELAMRRVAEAGRGVVVYLRGHEGRGIGLTHKLRAYQLQDGGLDTVDANLAQGLPVDSREYGIGAQILRDLGVHDVRLMTNNPAKYRGLAGHDIEVVGREPLIVAAHADNIAYLTAKRQRLNHDLAGALPAASGD